MFVLKLVMTKQCNLKCQYCYVKQNDSKLEKEDFKYLINYLDFILNYYNHNQLTVSFFGGEPLLNWEVLVYFYENMINTNYDIKNIHIISNGLLLDENKLNYVKKNNIGFSWSFDGLWTDKTRPAYNNKSTLKIYESKKDLIKQISKNAKVMIDNTIVDMITDNFIYLVEEWDMNLPDFTIVRDNIWDDDSIVRFEKELEKLTKVVIFYWKKGKKVLPGFYRLWALDSFMNINQGQKRNKACFAGNSGIAFVPDAKFYPCEKFSSNNKFILIDAKNDKIYYDNLRFLYDTKIYNPNKNNNCLNCSIYDICNMGCIYSQLENGDFKESKPLNNICKLFKIIFKNVQKLWNELGNEFDKYVLNEIDKLTRG